MNERYQADRRLLLVVAVLVAVVSVAYLAVGLSARSWQYALSLRIPKLLAMMVTGAAIAFSTVTFQTITNNRPLTPYWASILPLGECGSSPFLPANWSTPLIS